MVKRPASLRVSIIIPNWNGATHLPACLKSLKAQTYKSLDVTVADNGSTDGSQQLIAEQYSWARLIELPENRGFTGACNAGIAAAQGEILVLLNNDTEVEATWVAEVVAAFDRHPDAGLVASKMLLFDKRDTLHTAGDYYCTDGTPGNRGVWQTDTERYNTEEYVFSACGGSSAYRRVMLDEVGRLDDDFFFSCEDIDLAWRAQLAGWKCIYAPRAVVYHRLAATGGGPTASYFDGRNMIWVIAKNYPWPLFRRYSWQVLAKQINLAWDALRAWRGDAARARLRGMLAGIITLPTVMRKRRAIQASRNVTLDYIDSILTRPKSP